MDNSSLLSVETIYIIEICQWTFLYIPFLVLHLMVTFLLIRYWKKNYATAFYVYVLYLEFLDISQLFLLMFHSFRCLFNDLMPFQTYHTLNHVQWAIWTTFSFSVAFPQWAMMISRYLAVAKPTKMKVSLCVH